VKKRLASLYRRAESSVLERPRAVGSTTLATIFTLVDFRREVRATAAGRLLARTDDQRAALTALRRNVHRLEKGLVMRPRRVPFATSYIERTVDALAGLLAQDAIPDDDARWAADVIRTYFDAVEGVTDPAVTSAREAFDRLELLAKYECVPGPRREAPPLAVTVDQLEQLAHRRRSVRWFLPRPVDPADVDRALLIGAQAPSACNRQNLRLHIVYGEGTEAILRTVGGTRGFEHQVPCVAVVIGSLAGYRNTFDRHAVFIDAGLLSMGFILALETLGLSSCCINWPDVGRRYAAIRRHVPLRTDEQIMMLIAIGYADPDGLIPSSRKRGLDTLRTHVLHGAGIGDTTAASADDAPPPTTVDA
jgi:nitroreductase